MMRVFFPGLLLLVSLVVFVISGWLLVVYMGALHESRNTPWISGPGVPPIFKEAGSEEVGRQALIVAVSSGVFLLSTWAAAWAWERIRRSKMGRSEE